MAQARLDWLDGVRGVAILAVVFVHTGFVPEPRLLLPFLHSWMLPCFFIIGGLFAKTEPFLPWAAKRTRTLLVPYLVAGGVSFLGWLILRQTWLGPAITMPIPEALRYWVRGHDLWFNGALWFLPHYFLVQIFLLVTTSIIHRRRVIMLPFIIGALLAWQPYINPHHDHLLFSYDLLPLTASWALFGLWLQSFHFWRSFSVKHLVLLGILFLTTVLTNGSVDLFGRSYGSLSALYFLSGVAGTGFVAACMQHVSKHTAPSIKFLHTFLRFVGKNSLLILVTHWPLLQWLTVLFHWLGWLQPLTPTPNIIVFSSSSIDQGFLGDIMNTGLRCGLAISYTSICLLVLLIPLYRTLQTRQKIG